MFITGPNGAANPQPGSIIDTQLVEHHTEKNCFDFFLVPQAVTQGCVTPTHFYVSLNEGEGFSRTDMEEITYAFCYTYSNWSAQWAPDTWTRQRAGT